MDSVRNMDAASKISALSTELVALFSDERVTRELNEQLFAGLSNGESVSIELDGLGKIDIPPNCRHQVCSVVLQRDLVPPAEHARVFCAVGGIASESCGVIEPVVCFAVLEYNQDGLLLALDLHASQFY